MRLKWLFGAASAALMVAAFTPAASAEEPDVGGDAATRARLTDAVEGEIAPAADADWYRLRVTQGQRYQIALDAINAEDGSGLDPILAIYDRGGVQIAANDDNGETFNSALNYTPSQSGEIFVEARGFADESAGRYRLSVQASPAPADDAGNDATTRGRITASRSVTGVIEYEGDVDWRRLSVRPGQRYRLTLDSAEGEGGLQDPMLRLIDREGAELLSNDDNGENLNSALEYIPAQAGEVFVEASGFGGEQTGAYTLRVATEALPADAAAGATNTRARLALGQTVNADLGYAGDVDWYRIRLTAGESYRFTLSGSGDKPVDDPFLRIRDRSGEELASDDDGGEGLNSYLEFSAPSTGDYFIDAGAFSDGGEGGYTLTAAAGDIPADASTDAALAADGDGRAGVLAPSGDRDWYRLELEQGQGVRLSLDSTETEDALGDPMLVVHGPDGADLASDDDGGEGLNAWLEFQAPEAGVYYVEARGFVEDAAGRYFLSLLAGEIGADAESAEQLAANGEGRTSTIGAADDVDWFMIELIEGRPYRFNLEGVDPGPLADPVLTLYNSEGEQVASDDDGGRGLSSYLSFTPITGGVYYAAASAIGETEGAGRYLLRVSDTDVPGNANTDEYLDAASDERVSRIDMPGDLDSFTVELEAGVTYEIEVSGAGDNPLADPFLAVLNGAGERVSSDDDSGDGFDARVRFRPEEAGQYQIQASGLGGSTGWYSVKITRR